MSKSTSTLQKTDDVPPPATAVQAVSLCVSCGTRNAQPHSSMCARCDTENFSKKGGSLPKCPGCGIQLLPGEKDYCGPCVADQEAGAPPAGPVKPAKKSKAIGAAAVTVSRETKPLSPGTIEAAPLQPPPPADDWEDTETSLVHHIPLSSIVPFRFQPRRVFDEAELQELSDDIAENGVLQPVLVRPAEVGYELVAGERRWRASRLAGRHLIPAIVRELDDKTALKIAIAENDKRADVDPISRALSYQKLLELGGTQDEVARDLGKSRTVVTNALRLLELGEEVQAMISDGRLSEAIGKSLAVHKAYPEFLTWYAAHIMATGASSKQVEQGIGLSYEQRQTLGQKKLAVSIGYHYSQTYDVKKAAKAHPGAFLKDGINGSYLCLDLKLHEELSKQAKAEKDAAEAKKMEKVTAKVADSNGKGKLVKLSDIAHDKRTVLDNFKDRPAGCDKNCPCFGKALNWDDKPIDICTDPKRHRGLVSAQSRADNKKKRQENENANRQDRATARCGA